MIRVKVYNPIANEANAWWYWTGDDNGVFSLQFVRRLFEDNPEENDFRFDLHSPGGEVDEGFAIYDYLRTSGKNIYMNIEGGCHSMAVTLLLAAPKENRSANPNCLALIHQVNGYAGGTTSEVEEQAKEMRMMQDRMLDIYAERTGTQREILEALMMEERKHDAKELLQLGFISKINSYNTNYSPNKNFNMKNVKELKKSTTNFLNSIQKLLGKGSFNYEFVDENGEVLFTTEEESDTLEVGMEASPDGTFTIADGRTVTIADGVITEIQEAETSAEEGIENNSGEESAELENLRVENAELREALSNSAVIIRDLRSQISSNYLPGRRVGSQTNSKKGETKPTKEERQEAIREKLNKNKK